MSKNKHVDARDKSAKQSRGAIAEILHSLAALPVVLLLSLIISIGIEWVGIATDFWDLPGHLHAKAMMVNEARFLSDSFSESAVGKKLLSTAVISVEWVDTANSWLGFTDLSSASAEELTWYEIAYASAFYITKVFLLRLVVVLFNVPLFAIMGLIGIVFGLIARDLRRFGAATEHKKRFLLYFRLIKPAIWFSAVVYICWPDVINPMFVFVPAAFFFMYVLENSIKNFQKSF